MTAECWLDFMVCFPLTCMAVFADARDRVSGRATAHMDKPIPFLCFFLRLRNGDNVQGFPDSWQSE